MIFAWPAPEPHANRQARALLDRMTATVALANGLAGARRPVDLAGLERDAGRLCAQVLDLPPDEAGAFRPALVELVESVAALSLTIRIAGG